MDGAGKLALLTCLCLTVSVLAAGDSDQPEAGVVVTGRVFVDVDGDGEFGQGDVAARGAAVTDGLRFAEVDKDGEYRIEARVDPLLGKGGKPIVSVSFPDGTWPSGKWFAQVTRARKARVDFALTKRQSPRRFGFVHATDPHVPHRKQVPMNLFRADMTRRRKLVDFAIITGDLLHGADRWGPVEARRNYLQFDRLRRNFPVPLFLLPGNHDLAGVNRDDWNTKAPEYGYGLYHQHVGPLRWSFTYGGVHFVGLDCMRRSEKNPDKFLRSQAEHALQWLDADLKRAGRDTPKLLFTHFPFRVLRLSTLCVRHRVTAIFAGHTHTVGDYKVGPLRATLSGSVARILRGEHKPGWRMVTVSPEGVTSRYVPANSAVAGK
jgi:hypothetical protein